MARCSRLVETGYVFSTNGMMSFNKSVQNGSWSGPVPMEFPCLLVCPEGMTTIAYNTSKGAVLNFTRALGAEWGKYNITVNAICPGFFPSKMTMGTLKALGEEKLAAGAPLKRLGDDEDLKGLCVLYASDAGKHITGQWLAVDGGVSVVTGG